MNPGNLEGDSGGPISQYWGEALIIPIYLHINNKDPQGLCKAHEGLLMSSRVSQRPLPASQRP